MLCNTQQISLTYRLWQRDHGSRKHVQYGSKIVEYHGLRNHNYCYH